MADLNVVVAGETYKVTLEYDGYLKCGSLSADGETYVSSLLIRVEDARHFAANNLLDTYNEHWADGATPKLSAQGIAKHLIFKRLEILDAPGLADMYFSDGDLFAGHAVVVAFAGVGMVSVDLFG